MQIEKSRFPWYEIIEDSNIEQGDFLTDLPILIQPDTIPTSKDQLDHVLSTSIEVYNIVVMTQSCDFNKMEDSDLVTLCPRYDYRSLFGKDRWRPLIEGRIVGAHLLDKYDLSGYEFDYQVVDLTKIFSVPYSYVQKASYSQGKRVRLLPPYREHLSQAFAKRFMRVGLPLDLPRDYPYEK
jgi:hypothetical protein